MSGEGSESAQPEVSAGKPGGRRRVAPDRTPLGELQSERLAKLTGLPAEKLWGRTTAEITADYRWEIDLSLLLFQRVCGRVVKTDPVTGLDYPVPFATVHVEDTDCSFLGLFPYGSPWAWFYPYICRREEIATTTTDACGRFCVWIPRFEIDWILRWRLERHCYLDLFYKPTIRDILEHLKLIERLPPFPPKPEPDPAPFLLTTRDNGMGLRRLEETIGTALATRLVSAQESVALGGPGSEYRELLDRPAFPRPTAAPIPPRLVEYEQRFTERGATAAAELFGRAGEQFEGLHLQRYVGPFLRWRCEYEFKTEIVPIFDVPDVTFRIGQDVDGDGDEETIYDEGWFAVRWNDTSIPDVVLYANDSAIASVTHTCEPMPPVACDEKGIGLGVASTGFYPLTPPTSPSPGGDYYDPATGYALRVNRPHADAAYRLSTPADDPAAAPFCGTLLLRGCNQAEDAEYYRMWYSLNGGSAVPFLNHQWYIARPLGTTTQHVVPDPNGWYDILPDPEDWLVPYLLLAWPSSQYQHGEYDVMVELGDAAKSNLAFSATTKLRVDNSWPNASFTSFAWRPEGTGSWNHFPPPFTCCVIERPAGQAIELRVGYQVSATHLLDAGLGQSGCGSATDVTLLSPNGWSDPPGPENPTYRWHTSTAASENSVARTAIYRLPFAADNQGAYSFSVSGRSRAFNPTHPDGYALDWNNFDSAPIGGTLAYLPFAVVNA